MLTLLLELLQVFYSIFSSFGTTKNEKYFIWGIETVWAKKKFKSIIDENYVLFLLIFKNRNIEFSSTMFLQFYWPKIDPDTFYSYPSGVPYVQWMPIKRPYWTFGSLVDVPNETQSVQIGLKWTSILDLQGTPCMVSGHPLGPHQTSTRRLLNVH